MKKAIFSLVVLICCGAAFYGCKKDSTLTIVPSMTATLSTTSTFTADYIEPALIKSQIADTGTYLIVRGYQLDTKDTILLSVTKYRGLPGTFSIVKGEANAAYYHNGVHYYATGGIVAIKDASSNVINGYFNFTTAGGPSISSGDFVCGKPWDY